MAETPVVKDLVRKLKSFRDIVVSLNKCGIIRSSSIPPHIRHEVAKIYEEHGGLDILMDVLHVSADQIREWKRNVKSNPNYYLKLPTKGTANNIIGITSFKKKKKISELKVKGESFKMTQEIQQRCEDLKRRMTEFRFQNHGRIDFELRKEIADLVKEVGAVRPLTKLLGISEKRLSTWNYKYNCINPTFDP